jgi:hypothetical protein
MIKRQGNLHEGNDNENQHGCAPLVIQIDWEEKENN